MTTQSIKISNEFKSQTTKAISAIIFFIFTYILLLVMAVALTIFCVYAGIMLILIKPMIITIALGAGLASLGILVLIFLLKFIFKSHKIDRSHLVEINKKDEPQLFEIINDIVLKVGTSFPKKVYLSSDVNAAVFYDSNFWSMFLPIKKNLLIGIGLINSVTKDELISILSHEFGHFSQKSMKVGSYVYNVNQIIYNLLEDNDSYGRLIQSWASLSSFMSIFVILAVRIIEGIQWILSKLFNVVNKSYLSLSREMEFHADEIAASVTGYEPLKSSLLRLPLADQSFNSVLSFYDGKVQENVKSDNLYKEQSFAMNFIAEESQIEIKHKFPVINQDELSRFDKSKLVIKDQWASHPSTEDRIERLEKTGLSAKKLDLTPANLIFKNIEQIQKEFTNKIFNNVEYKGDVSLLGFQNFKKEFQDQHVANTFPKIYNSYYDNKNPIPFDLDITINAENLDVLFSDEMVDTIYTEIALKNDIEALKQIANKTYPVNTFDYDGKKYNQKDSKVLLNKLKKELEDVNEEIKQNDISIFSFFQHCEVKKSNAPLLQELYTTFFEFHKEYDTKYELYSKLSSDLQFINEVTPFDQIISNFSKIKPLENELKNSIRELLSDDICKPEINSEIKTNFELYLSDTMKYAGNENYYDKNLQILFEAMNNYAFILSRKYFLLKKKLLDYQVQLLETKE